MFDFNAGWRVGLLRCTVAAGIVALTNVVCLGVATSRLRPFNRRSAFDNRQAIGDGALFEGNCDEAKELSLWLHLLINVLSTVLMATGNYAQQVLTAPTRKDIDESHRRGMWLDIGVQSYHNLKAIPWKRVAAWGFLALSSIPIHLFYNSIIALETSVNQYNVWMISSDNITNPEHKTANGQPLNDFVRLDKADCIETYGKTFLTHWADVILVVEPEPSKSLDDNALLYESNPVRAYSVPWGWMCSGKTLSLIENDVCDISGLTNGEEWTVLRALDYQPYYTDEEEQDATVTVNYCLAKPTDESCRLTMSIPLLATVVGCNLVKLVGLFMTWYHLDDDPLLTLGDAMASFLERPDPYTAGRPIISKRPGACLLHTEEREWELRRHRWAWLISRRRHALTMGLCLIAIIVVSALLGQGISHISYDPLPSFADLWDRGFGDIDVDCLVTLNRGGERYENSTIAVILLSNLPQLLVSFLYVSLNGMWTTMHVGLEWNSFGLERKPLRTTKPVGKQHGTHWLSLPWQFGAPLVVASALLHWLISQSIFFVRLVINDGHKVHQIVTTPGYSPMSIIAALTCGVVIVATTVGFGFRRFEVAIPQVGTCSAVVCAACHPPEYDESPALEAVQWGIVAGKEEGDYRCVTSLEVQSPQGDNSSDQVVQK